MRGYGQERVMSDRREEGEGREMFCIPVDATQKFEIFLAQYSCVNHSSGGVEKHNYSHPSQPMMRLLHCTMWTTTSSYIWHYVAQRGT